MNKLKHLSHSVGQNYFHFVWKPKWAWDPFKFQSVKAVCEAAIRNAAYRHGIELVEIEVMPDHVHCFVGLHPTMSICKALQLLKRFSAKKIFEHHPWLRKYFRTGHLWSPGKFFRSVGSVTKEAIEHYIRESNGSAKQQASLKRYLALQGEEVHSIEDRKSTRLNS